MVSSLDPNLGIHDFRMVTGEEQINLIFDLVVPWEYSQKQGEKLMHELSDRLHEIDRRYRCVITIEQSYVAK